MFELNWFGGVSGCSYGILGGLEGIRGFRVY
jgi:hypothetical protein